MNWTVLVYGGPMLMIIIWWIVSAHKWFKGPKVYIFPAFFIPVTCLRRLLMQHDQVNIEHQMLGREGNVLEGKEHDSGDSSAGSITKEDRVLDDKRASELA